MSYFFMSTITYVCLDLIEKARALFESKELTSEQKEDKKYFISVVYIVGVLSGSKDGRKYWNKLKQRLKEENKTVINRHQLKLIV